VKYYQLSIISWEWETTTDLKTILDNQNLVYSWYNNLSSNYIWSKYKTDEWFEFTSEKLVVYSDSQSCAPLYDSEDPTARIDLIKNLQTAYSWTLIENDDNIRQLVAINITDIPSLSLLSAILVNNNLWGEIISYTSDALICETWEHTEDWINCIPDTWTCSITNWTWIDTWNWTSWDCILNTCNEDYYNNWDDTCSPVWIWYFSNATETTRTACINNPDTSSRNYTYTSDWNGTNSCAATYTDLCWIDLYETVNWICTTVWIWYYSANLNNIINTCTKPDNSIFTSDWDWSDDCSISCTWWYSWVNCEVPNPYANCTWPNTPSVWTITTTTTYGLCNTTDILVCSWNWTWYTIAACNVWTNIAWITWSSYWSYIQFWKSDNSWDNWNALYSYDWKSPWWISNWSSEDWWVEYNEETTAKYSNQTLLDQNKMQWPCLIWYHVPTQNEWSGLHIAWNWLQDLTSISSDLLLPIAWYRNWSDGIVKFEGINGGYWSSSPKSTTGYRMFLYTDTVNPAWSMSRSYWLPVRCFKN